MSRLDFILETIYQIGGIFRWEVVRPDLCFGMMALATEQFYSGKIIEDKSEKGGYCKDLTDGGRELD